MKKPIEETIPYKDGYHLGESIKRVVDKFYNNQTAEKFYIGFLSRINKDLIKRNINISIIGL